MSLLAPLEYSEKFVAFGIARGILLVTTIVCLFGIGLDIMLRNPRFYPHLQVKVVEGQGVFVLSETRQRMLRGELYEKVAPLLDGRSVQDVCAQLRGQIPATKVYYTLNKLEQSGLVCESTPNESSASTSAFWTIQGLEPHEFFEQAARSSVKVVGLGVDVKPLEAVLSSNGVSLVTEKPDLEIVVADSYLRKALRSKNKGALDRKRPWLLVKPVGTQMWIGPMFVPGQTGCWECLARRLRANSPVLGYLDSLSEEEDLVPPDPTCTPATLAWAWGMVATAVSSWVTYADDAMPSLVGKIISVDSITWELQEHNLTKQPHCPSCGASPPQEPKPIDLKSRKKLRSVESGHRAVTPAETVSKYEHLVSPISGFVTELDRQSAADGPMHVYISGANVARGPESLWKLRVDLRNASAGKGISDIQAKASALCEALERYSGIFQGNEPRRSAVLAELGEDGIHPNECMLYSEKQYRERDLVDQDFAPFYSFVPLPFESEKDYEWTPVWSLTNSRVRYLPTAFCYFDYPVRNDRDVIVGCSNGNAAGNTLEEAILQGFFELVERDSVGIWWYNRAQVPEVDIESFDDPYLNQLKEFYDERNRDLWVLDLTTDVGVPVLVSVCRRRMGDEQLMFGFGCHTDPRIALTRSVTELNQHLVHIMNHEEDGEGTDLHITDADTLDWLQYATIEEHKYLVPRSDAPIRDASFYKNEWSDDLLEDVHLCRKKVEALGLEMLVLDQTRPEVGMPVVKVIVPGLRHFWARFGPGRLYDVPVKLGWLQEPRREEDLNPVHMFL